jgi:hypothetical protein
MLRKRITQTPVILITYDGTGGNKNDVIIPYLTFPQNSDELTRRKKSG